MQCHVPVLTAPPVSPPPHHTPQLTYPLDTLRLRLAVDPKLRGLGGAVSVLIKEGSGAAFYRGLGASMLGAAWHVCAVCVCPVDP